MCLRKLDSSRISESARSRKAISAYIVNVIGMTSSLLFGFLLYLDNLLPSGHWVALFAVVLQERVAPLLSTPCVEQ